MTVLFDTSVLVPAFVDQLASRLPRPRYGEAVKHDLQIDGGLHSCNMTMLLYRSIGIAEIVNEPPGTTEGGAIQREILRLTPYPA